ncbi:MAG: 3'-5' exonuclease, partial [Spirochaetales bacterium]
SLQQYELMHLLADKNIAVVGDDDQSIYSWRGANYENILLFEKDFPHVQEIRLEQNYRSTETILAAANGVIAHNTNRKDKALWSGNGSGKPIELFFPENEADEADFIAESIQGIRFEEKKLYGDFGVLIRANTLTAPIEEAFLDANIPYTVSGGTSFYQRKEIKDIISYLRICSNHHDDINLLRVINTPHRGIGRKTIEQLNKIAKEKSCSLWEAIEFHIDEHKKQKLKTPQGAQEMFDEELMQQQAPHTAPASHLEEFYDLIVKQRAILLGSTKGLAKKVRDIVEEIDYWSYLVREYQKNEKAARFKYLNIEHLINSITTWENNPDTTDAGLYAWLNRITLLSRDDQEDNSILGKVNLMTIHASKGLEFPVVFIAGCEEGIIPHARSIEENEANREEERRLFYVAITRAQDKLYITSCRKRKKNKATVECEPSPFLDEIPAHLVEFHDPSTEPDDEAIELKFAKMKERYK